MLHRKLGAQLPSSASGTTKCLPLILLATFLASSSSFSTRASASPSLFGLFAPPRATASRTLTSSTVTSTSTTATSLSASTSTDSTDTDTDTMEAPNANTNSNIPLTKLTNHANSYAAAHGLQVQSASSSSYQCAPISLLPNIFPHASFTNAQSLAPSFNMLVDRISRDADFLNDTLGGEGGVTSKDEYTAKLLQLYNKIYGTDANDDAEANFAGIADRLGIQRSDYMLNENGSQDGVYELKQVELNTIAASFAGLAVNVAGLHKMLTQRFSHELKDWIETNQKAVMGENYKSNEDVQIGVPNNPALESLPLAMNVAHTQYKSRFNSESDTTTNPTAILFVVQEGETNTVDQRMLEFQLWKNHEIPVIRMSLTKAHTHLEFNQDNGAMYVLPDDDDDGDGVKYEVSVVYFRAGYAPTDYPDGYDGIEWSSREKIERSRSTKCPSLGYHLAGTKKVQQELARPGVLEQFFFKNDNDSNNTEDQGMVDSMREAFAGLYSLGDDAVQEDLDAVKDAISGSDGKYVLKPQREGGGYNYYGERLSAKLKENIDDESAESGDSSSLKLGEDLAEFILMQRLFPPKQRAVLLRAGMVEGTGESISELGCFGAIVQTHDGNTLHNEYCGFLLRTKFSNVDEGGVASGFATLSSPYLC